MTQTIIFKTIKKSTSYNNYTMVLSKTVKNNTTGVVLVEIVFNNIYYHVATFCDTFRHFAHEYPQISLVSSKLNWYPISLLCLCVLCFQMSFVFSDICVVFPSVCLVIFNRVLCFSYLFCVLYIELCFAFVLCLAYLCCVLYVCVVFCTCGSPYWSLGRTAFAD